MKRIYLMLAIFFLGNNIIEAQNYIGLNIGAGADKITIKENTSFFYQVLGKGYKTYHGFYGLRFESDFSKHFGFSFNNNFANYLFTVYTRGIVPIDGIQYQLLRSSLVFKYAPIKQFYVGAGINTLITRERTVYRNGINTNKYNEFAFREMNSIVVLGTKLNRFLVEFYWINPNVYQSKNYGLNFNPIQSIGVSASCLLRLPERNKKKAVDCPKF